MSDCRDFWCPRCGITWAAGTKMWGRSDPYAAEVTCVCGGLPPVRCIPRFFETPVEGRDVAEEPDDDAVHTQCTQYLPDPPVVFVDFGSPTMLRVARHFVASGEWVLITNGVRHRRLASNVAEAVNFVASGRRP